MQGFRLAAISDVEKPNFDVNVDRRTNKRTDGRTEIWTPISHPAISRCDNKNTGFCVFEQNLKEIKMYST